MESKQLDQDDILNGDEVVITGMSGIFPKSDSILEFMENLYNKVDMVISIDPNFVHPSAPKYLGKLKGLNKFDAQFFKVTFKQAMTLDPGCRKLMEHAYTALYDAGINPLSIKGNRIGVYAGTSYMDSVRKYLFSSTISSSFCVSSCAKTMFPNRVSYLLNGRGPSFCIDGSTASSVLCLEQAYQNLVSGKIDVAIVAGTNICIEPTLAVNLNRLGIVCLDGKTKCFDKNGDGCVRAEAVSAILLQRAKDAKRIYCQLYHVKSSYSKPDFHCLPVRQETEIINFLKKFYDEIDIDPSEVEYVEANANGVAKSDEQELMAISNFFGKRSIIKVGSLKSNIGDSEGASGMCGITKACLAYHTGQIASNINCINTMDCTNNVVILKENVPFGRGFIAINDFSYTGIDGHILLKGFFKSKELEHYDSNIPYLVNVSGRREDCVNHFFDCLQSYLLDPELIGMIHGIHKYEIKGHTARGFILLGKNENKHFDALCRSVEYYAGNKRPVWFVFSGMGSQWVGMGADLMRIPMFSESIKKCDKALRPKGIDIVKIITVQDKTMFDNILNCFLGITAIQIGLIDILKSLEIECDYMIGHSVGETACAYADGCLTAEEMILSSYSRGLSSLETNFIQGTMAAVGLGYKDLYPLCPSDIDIACHNSSESSTISGPANAVSEFVKQLKEKGIFAKEVPSCNIPYHSRYIAAAGPTLRRYLADVIKEPKLRSNKWLSTSVPEELWQEPSAKYISSEYFINNLLNFVFFEETCRHIPSDAILIEIAPHGLLQAILKRSHQECLHIPLTRRGHEDQVKFLMEAIGKIYEAGVNVNLETLYPKINYPVSTGTQFLSHLVKWEHSEDWPELTRLAGKVVSSRCRDVVVSIYDDDYASIKRNLRHDSIVFPESALLVLTWETLAMSMNMDYKDVSVIFTNVKFYKQINVNTDNILNFTIAITKQEGKFEIIYEKDTLISGFIKEHDKGVVREINHLCDNIENEVTLSALDVYKFFNLRGHVYRNEFQSLHSLNLKSKEAYIKWTGNWTTFLDGLIQVNIFANEYNGVSSPKLAESLSINVIEHAKSISEMNGITGLKADYYQPFGVLRCGGVQLKNLEFKNVISPQTLPDYIGNKQFWSHFPKTETDVHTAISINIQIIGNTLLKKEINLTVQNAPKMNIILNVLNDILITLPINTKVFINNIEDGKAIDLIDHVSPKSDVLIVYDFVMDTEKIAAVHEKLSNDGFIISLEKKTNEKYIIETDYFNIVTSFPISDDLIIALLHKVQINQKHKESIIFNMDITTSFTNIIQNELNHCYKRIVLLFEKQSYCDLTGYLKLLREKYENRITLFMIFNSDFIVDSSEYSKQLQKNLPLNTLCNGQWGGHYYINCNNWSSIPRNYKLSMAEVQNFEALKWEEIDVPKSMNSIQVSYGGISLRDIESSMDSTLSSDLTFGMDFSGFDNRGKRVMGLISGGALAREIECDIDLLWPVPDHWSLAEAATVPLPFIQAYYCLVMRANIRSGASVFVNGGAGAFGQAVISICLSINCDVYTSVSNLTKKKKLLHLFPTLNENKIFNSNDDVFASVIKQTENGLCNCVINCESGPSRQAAMKCVALFGSFMDLSTHDMIENTPFGLHFMEGFKHYYSVTLSSIFRPEYSMEKKILQQLLAEGIVNGVVRPLTYSIFSCVEIPRAFSFLSSRQHIGRVIINLRDDLIINTTNRLILNPEHTYVVIGDQDEFCIALLDLLIERGAKKIFLHLKSKTITSFLEAKLMIWNDHSIVVKLNYNKIEDENECSDLLNNALELGPLEGIFIFPKILETSQRISFIKNLDKISRYIDSIRYFVIFMKNLCAKNTGVEDEYLFSNCSKICEYRNNIGLSGLLYRAEFMDEFQDLSNDSSLKLRPQTIQQVLSGLEKCLKMNHSNAITFNTNKCVNIDYLMNINGILEKYVSNNVSDNNLLLSNVDTLTLKKIRSLILDCYKIDVSINKLKKMSITSIQNIGNDLNKSDGLDAFLDYFDDYSYAATDLIKVMLTSLNNMTEVFENMESIDPDADYLLLIPGFEGHSRIFESLCLSLKLKAITLQLGSDLIGNSIPEMAENIMKNIVIKLEEKKRFYILGYSFGVNIALELAAILEKKGIFGVVFCLDSSPEALKIQLDSNIGGLTEEQLQNILIHHIYYMITKENNDKLCHDLEKLQTFDQKVAIFLREVKIRSHCPIEYIKLTLESAYKIIVLALRYNPSFILESKLILIKGTPFPDAENLPYDYYLSKYSKIPIKIVNIHSNHKKAPFDVKVPSIINQLIDPENLKTFKNTNRCITYTVLQ